MGKFIPFMILYMVMEISGQEMSQDYYFSFSLPDAKIDNIDEVVYDLAFHFYSGYDFDRALSYSIEGGEKAIKSYANKEALNLYGISLNSLRRLDEKLANTNHYKEKKIEVLTRLGILNKTILLPK